ncbi:MAG: vitamin B12 dependent-methionine synthase activation domain-containing protein [Candidatus Hodarchaeales archaeon]|jgi:hypothetical protein
MLITFTQEIQIEDKEIIRLLHRKRKKKSVSSEILEQLKQMKIQAKTLIEPKAIYKVFNVTDLPLRECFEEAEKVALAICTIGKELPNQVNSLINEGKLVKAVLLDAIGSVTVEAVAELVNQQINEESKKLSLEFTERYSPGYCHWEVKDQKIIFQRLPADEIDVQLSDSFMMVPLKSISFAVNLGRDISESRWERRCTFCEKEKCSYRRN